MDTFTHALLGASLAHACQPSRQSDQYLKLSHRVTLGAMAAAFPDIDYVTYLIDPLSFISHWHRAETHSFILLPLWAVLIAWSFTRITHQQTKLKEAIIICSLSLSSHIFSDLITSWGTQIFAPFSNARYALGISFVIDPYFSTIIVLGLIIGWWRHTATATRTALFFLLMYMTFQLTLKMEAANIAKQQVEINQWKNTSVYTMPQPFSPFHWKLIISSGEQHYLSYLSLYQRQHLPFLPHPVAKIVSHYQSSNKLHWQTFNRYGHSSDNTFIKSAWQQPVFQRYREFARFPAYYRHSLTADEQCSWFLDLRYTLPELKPSFIYGACQNLTSPSQWLVKQYQ